MIHLDEGRLDDFGEFHEKRGVLIETTVPTPTIFAATCSRAEGFVFPNELPSAASASLMMYSFFKVSVVVMIPRNIFMSVVIWVGSVSFALVSHAELAASSACKFVAAVERRGRTLSSKYCSS